MTNYVADKKVCAECPLRSACTHSELGRSVARHWREQDLEVALALARLPEAQANRRRRRSLMEGSFARTAKHYHFKRARLRRLPRKQIQNWIIAAVQNSARPCGATGVGVAAKPPKVPREGAAAASRLSLFARTAENGAVIVKFPRYSDLPGRFHAA